MLFPVAARPKRVDICLVKTWHRSFDCPYGHGYYFRTFLLWHLQVQNLILIITLLAFWIT